RSQPGKPKKLLGVEWPAGPSLFFFQATQVETGLVLAPPGQVSLFNRGRYRCCHQDGTVTSCTGICAHSHLLGARCSGKHLLWPPTQEGPPVTLFNTTLYVNMLEASTNKTATLGKPCRQSPAYLP
ncbi:hypothetical protein LEMLEM_LOCUS19016, partial [Lemmus lemmus]